MMTSWRENTLHNTGTLWGKPCSLVDYLLKGPVTWSFDVSFANLLNKQLSYRWFETPWPSCEATLICTDRRGYTLLSYNMFNVLWCFQSWFGHDDVIKWKHFPCYWPFVRPFTGSGEFPAQRPVTRSFDVFFDLCLNKRLRKQSWGWWFETLSRPLWHYNDRAVVWFPVSLFMHIWQDFVSGAGVWYFPSACKQLWRL